MREVPAAHGADHVVSTLDDDAWEMSTDISVFKRSYLHLGNLSFFDQMAILREEALFRQRHRYAKVLAELALLTK
jgi:hypothetical protein